MDKKIRFMAFLTSIITVLPTVVGLLLWNRLPEQVPIHWNAQGVVDGYSSRAFAVFALPAFLLALHWVCILATRADPKSKSLNGKPMLLVLWITPLLSLLISFFTYAAALGSSLRVEIIMPIIMGLMFIAIGNYLPKCKQNYTVGIKIPWTLNDPENWNRTHRFAGPLWVVGGICIIGSTALGSFPLQMVFVAVIVLAPMVYSYLLYRKSAK